MLQVRLLGQFDVRVEGIRVTIPSRAGQSLFAFLILTAGTAHRREKLAGQFWPDTSDDNARRNLRQELWRIRKALVAPQPLAVDYIHAEELTITFNPHADYWLDVAQLEQPISSTDDLNQQISKVVVYQGELLPGLYDDWVVLERERVQALFESRMRQLLERLIEEQRWATVLEWSERWIALGNAPEPAYRALMLAYAALGDKSKVVSTYERCVEALDKELSVEPSDETRSLSDQLMRGETVAGVDLSATRVSPARAPTLNDPPAPGDPPFKGLQYFDEGDAALFFGRELLTAKLIGRLRESRFLAVVIGASGSGKSSIVRAGVLPALRRGELLADGVPPPVGSTQWQMHILTPTAHPLESLAVSLTHRSESVTATATLMDDLARDARSLHLFVRRTSTLSENTSHLLLVVDQFEELFTLCRDPFEREAFIDNLLAAIAPESGGLITLIITIRADFYAHLAQYPELRDAVAQRQEYIGPMTVEELRRAIEEPAKRNGWEFQPGLADVMLRDVGDEPGALPLLSHALLETWQRRSGRRLTLKGYADSGGVRGAIAHTAETVYQELAPSQQAIARNIFLRLTELGEGTDDTRRRATLRELVTQLADEAQVRTVLTKLADARLITTSADGAEVAHEALIREWPTLRQWLTQDREGLLLHRHLTDAAREWELLERDPGALYRGARLAQALEWAQANSAILNVLDREFLEASQALAKREATEREAQRQRELEAARRLAEAERKRADERALSVKQLRQRAVYLAIALAIAVVLAFASTLFGQRASQNFSAAQVANTQAAVQRDAALDAQATSQTEAVMRATAESIAVLQRAEAQRQALIASVRELAGAANLNLDVDPERSILLALQAIALTDAAGQPPLLEAQDALHRAVQTSRVQLTLRGHTRELTGLTFSRDGTRLATIGDDATIRVWETATGKELLSIPITITATNLYRILSFSPDGKRLAAGDGHLAKVWNVASGQELLILPEGGHTDDVLAVAFSPDGTRLATASADGVVKVWDAVSGQEVLALSGPVPPNSGSLPRSPLAFSPDGMRLATARNTIATVWDITSGQTLLTLTQADLVNTVVFSPDGNHLATGSSNGSWMLWDVSTGQSLLTIFGHSTLVTQVIFDLTGKRLATAGEDGTAKIWDAATGRELLTLSGHVSGVESVAFSPDGRLLATASRDATLKVWDISPHGGSEWFNLAGHTNGVWGLAYSSDGARIATGSRDKTVKIWNALTGDELFTLPSFTFLVNRIAFSPDGTRLIVNRGTENEFDATVWDLATRTTLLTLHHDTLVFGAAYSPDGKYIATGSADGVARIWEAETGNLLHVLSGHTALIQWIAFSPDSKRLATASEDGTAKVWDAATGKTLLTLSGHTGVVWGVAFSPDGSLLATTSNDGTAKVWDVATGRELFTLAGHTGPVFSVAFSPDGKRLATVSVDRTVKIWDVSAGSGAQPLTLYGHTAAVLGVAFSPDGTRLVTTSRDGTARVYALRIEDLVALARTRLTRSLTTEECQTYLHLEACPVE